MTQESKTNLNDFSRKVDFQKMDLPKEVETCECHFVSDDT